MHDAVSAYFDAWNRHDADGIIDTFGEGGTYADPAAGKLPAGEPLRAYVEGLWEAFPDLAFEVTRIVDAGDGTAAEWRMRGTNESAFRGLPPTGRCVDLPGADFIEVRGGRIAAVRGYFDGGAVPRQLGHMVVVQPAEIGPFSFGTSVRVAGDGTVPGAFALTRLDARDDAEIPEVRDLGRRVLQALPGTDGFAGALTATAGRRMMTVTAWRDAEAARAVMDVDAHGEAVRRFFDDLSAGGITSVWTPDRINTNWVRCAACGRMAAAADTCRCGAALPEPPAFW